MPPHAAIVWPVKRREIHTVLFDSRIWNDFEFRDDDIVVATYAKSGTTWLQQILGQLIFEGREGLPVERMSPWLDFTLPSAAEKLDLLRAQTHRRFIKTHLPVDALVFSPRARYLYIARDGRDVVWSFHNHHANFKKQTYEVINSNPGRGAGADFAPPTGDVGKYFRDWFERDGYPFWPFWENVRSWWAIRDLPNVMLLHYENLKRDMAGEMRRVAKFLDIPINEARWPTIVEYCTFDYMKAHPESVAPLGGVLWEGGGKTFVFKGTNGRWRNVLSAAESQAYEERAVRELGPDCARWLATGN
jgi:aryl sulfotransferase